MSSTLPAGVNLEVYRGDTWSQQFRLRRGDVPEDLAGATVEAEARGRDGQRHALVVDVLDAAAGLVAISLPLAGIPPGTYQYDLEVADGGAVTTWVQGRMSVARDVTNELP